MSVNLTELQERLNELLHYLWRFLLLDAKIIVLSIVAGFAVKLLEDYFANRGGKKSKTNSRHKKDRTHLLAGKVCDVPRKYDSLLSERRLPFKVSKYGKSCLMKLALLNCDFTAAKTEKELERFLEKVLGMFYTPSAPIGSTFNWSKEENTPKCVDENKCKGAQLLCLLEEAPTMRVCPQTTSKIDGKNAHLSGTNIFMKKLTLDRLSDVLLHANGVDWTHFPFLAHTENGAQLFRSMTVPSEGSVAGYLADFIDGFVIGEKFDSKLPRNRAVFTSKNRMLVLDLHFCRIAKGIPVFEGSFFYAADKETGKLFSSRSKIENFLKFEVAEGVFDFLFDIVRVNSLRLARDYNYKARATWSSIYGDAYSLAFQPTFILPLTCMENFASETASPAVVSVTETFPNRFDPGKLEAFDKCLCSALPNQLFDCGMYSSLFDFIGLAPVRQKLPEKIFAKCVNMGLLPDSHVSYYHTLEQFDRSIMTYTSMKNIRDAELNLAPKPDPTKGCEFCQSKTKNLCAGCRVVYYCSIECQQQDWERHRPRCEAQTKKNTELAQQRQTIVNENSVPKTYITYNELFHVLTYEIPLPRQPGANSFGVILLSVGDRSAAATKVRHASNPFDLANWEHPNIVMPADGTMVLLKATLQPTNGAERYIINLANKNATLSILVHDKCSFYTALRKEIMDFAPRVVYEAPHAYFWGLLSLAKLDLYTLNVESQLSPKDKF